MTENKITNVCNKIEIFAKKKIISFANEIDNSFMIVFVIFVNIYTFNALRH